MHTTLPSSVKVMKMDGNWGNDPWRCWEIYPADQDLKQQLVTLWHLHPDREDHYAEVNGVRLHYGSVGQGPLVLFLHGYPSFWYQWKDQMLEIGRDHLA